jgi:hypothetical protein
VTTEKKAHKPDKRFKFRDNFHPIYSAVIILFAVILLGTAYLSLFPKAANKPNLRAVNPS